MNPAFPSSPFHFKLKAHAMEESFPWDQPEPATQPQPAPQAPDRSNGVIWLIIGVLVGALLFQALNGGGNWVMPQPDPHDEKQDDGKRDDNRVKPDLKGGAILVVDESASRSVDQQLVLNDWNFFNKEIKERWGLSFEYREADLPEVKEVLAPDAKTKNVSPPFVSLYDVDGKFIDAIPFPTTDTAPIAEMIKRHE